MLNRYIHDPHVQQESTCITDNSLHVFLAYLEFNGYAIKTIHDYLGAVLHFSRWLHQNGKTLAEATDDSESKFTTTHISHCHCPHSFPRNKKIIAAALHRWSDVIGIQTIASSSSNETEQLIVKFDDYLANVIGISVATRLYRRRHVHEFLQFVTLRHLSALTQNEIENYLVPARKPTTR